MLLLARVHKRRREAAVPWEYGNRTMGRPLPETSHSSIITGLDRNDARASLICEGDLYSLHIVEDPEEAAKKATNGTRIEKTEGVVVPNGAAGPYSSCCVRFRTYVRRPFRENHRMQLLERETEQTSITHT